MGAEEDTVSRQDSGIAGDALKEDGSSLSASEGDGPGNQAAVMDALRERNHALAQALNRAGKELAKAKTRLAQMASPPLNFALALGVDSVSFDEMGVQHASLEVLYGSRRMVLALAPGVRADRIRPGQTLLLDENMVVVQVRDQATTGPLRQVSRIMDSGILEVKDASGASSLVGRSGALMDADLSVGNQVMVDPAGQLALSLVPEQEQNDLVLEEVPDVTFADIGGLDRQIDRIRDAVQLPFLHKDLFRRFSLNPPKGLLLYGPPGNGKTMIAKAVANSLSKGSGTPGVFLSVKGPELLNKFVGESERLMRRIFERARQRAGQGGPVIVFIDEMDSLLRTRGSGISSDVETTIVPQFLAELDGVEALDNVMVIGASNRVDMIDPAVLRPGRLDVKVRIDRPDRDAAASILSRYVTPDLPLKPEEGGVDDLVQVLVRDIYREDQGRKVCDLLDQDGRWYPFYMSQLISGAVLRNIVDRAKTMAVKDSIRQDREVTLDADRCLQAVQEEYLDMLDSVGDQNPQQWARTAGLSVGRVADIRLIGRTDTES
ncbi:AAA ATPase domain protein [Bifidobacterium coryneforme]|uniref:AAA ATPase domain protein n=2 Tax=Bifidobacterium coryneforme TaxID=1687 RepID=A0ABD4AEN0_9BIFI|nr:AAA ATPase domain protein [Bifidobacterium coryneforme]